MIRLDLDIWKFRKPLWEIELFNWSKTWNTPWEHKYFELQLTSFPAFELVDFSLNTHWYGEDHAGFKFRLSILGFYFGLDFYDSRHWNYDKGRWYFPGEEAKE